MDEVRRTWLSPEAIEVLRTWRGLRRWGIGRPAASDAYPHRTKEELRITTGMTETVIDAVLCQMVEAKVLCFCHGGYHPDLTYLSDSHMWEEQRKQFHERQDAIWMAIEGPCGEVLAIAGCPQFECSRTNGHEGYHSVFVETSGGLEKIKWGQPRWSSKR